MKRKYLFAGPLLGLALTLAACASNEAQIGAYLEKHPEVVFKAIESHPEEFIDVVNKAARKAQEAQYKKQAEEQQAQRDEQRKNPLKPVLNDDRRLVGAKNASVQIVEYADFQCPACGMAYNALKTVKEKYKDRVQFYYKHMPLDFHKMAYPSAVYFEALKLQDKEKARKFYDVLFENQRELSESFLNASAKKVGADMKRLEADLKSDKVKKVIEADMGEFEKFGFTGTPVIVINGVAMHGAQPAEELEKMIDQALAGATKQN